MREFLDNIIQVDRAMFLLSRTKNKRIQNKLLKRIERLNIAIFAPDFEWGEPLI